MSYYRPAAWDCRVTSAKISVSCTLSKFITKVAKNMRPVTCKNKEPWKKRVSGEANYKKSDSLKSAMVAQILNTFSASVGPNQMLSIASDKMIVKGVCS